MKHLIETWNEEWVICVLYDIANNSTFSVDDTLSTTTAVTAAVMTCQQCYMEPSLSAVAWWDSDSSTWNRHCQLSPDEMRDYGAYYFHTYTVDTRQLITTQYTNNIAFWSKADHPQMVHVVTRGHFRSRDKESGHTIRSAIAKNFTLLAKYSNGVIADRSFTLGN